MLGGVFFLPCEWVIIFEMDKIAVLIPCYNEEKTIGKVIDDARAALPEAKIYVYNNRSTDKTAEIALERGAILRQEYVQGKGNVVRRMFREIDAECYLLIDGDDTYPLEEAPKMVDLVMNHNADMVVGDRLSSTYFKENKRPFHGFGNSLVRFAINRLFKSKVKDVMTGYRAFSFSFVKTFPVLSGGFEIETEMTIHALYYRMQIDNLVVAYRDRPAGSVSKLNTFSDGFQVLRTIFRLYKCYKPKRFFFFFAFVFFALGIGFFIPVLIDFINTGEVARFPTLFMCCTAIIAGLLSFFTGLILANQEDRNRREFEFRRNLIAEIEHDKRGKEE